jgi:hypothetical protein
MEKPTANAPDQVRAPILFSFLPNNHPRKTQRGFARTSSFVGRTAKSRFARSSNTGVSLALFLGGVELMTNQGLVIDVGAIW